MRINNDSSLMHSSGGVCAVIPYFNAMWLFLLIFTFLSLLLFSSLFVRAAEVSFALQNSPFCMQYLKYIHGIYAGLASNSV